ncbi:MAG: family 20 glycosylhydrolase, partial [Candidatus Aminicenantales bacterium]
AVLYVPTIRDWPAMPHRGLSDDWSRGPIPNMDFLKREIRTLGAYKINIFSPYFEHTFAYAASPIAAFPGGAMTPAEGRELVAYAAQYHITIIPEQESFGHLHHLLKFEQFSPLAETPHGAVLAPADPATLPLISSWFTELAEVFPGPYAHVGADETFELGLGRTKDAVAQKGLGAVYLDFLTRIHQTLEPLHKHLLFWGDVAVHSPDLVATLPKDMIAVPWDYDPKPDFKPIIQPFTKAGLETWVSPGVNNWNRIYPDNNDALANIRAFVRDGQSLGSTGVLNTVWNDDGEGIFDENWVGVLFGAAAGWQPGESSESAFLDSFGQAFHQDDTGKISQAHRELMAAHALLRKAGLYDAQDTYFWLDPFTPEGQQTAAKLLPVAVDVRLHAEAAVKLLAEARAAAQKHGRTLANPDALDALELGARRIDFMAYKFQAAQ